MEVSFLLIFIATIFFLIKVNAKVHFLNLRDGSEKIKAQVIEYRKEKGPIRNDYTMLNYPYVKILTDGPDQGKVRRLRYATNWSKQFKIGQTIHVFRNSGELLYWDAMEEGIKKYLPSKWPWKK
jgi:hypothetical protein